MAEDRHGSNAASRRRDTAEDAIAPQGDGAPRGTGEATHDGDAEDGVTSNPSLPYGRHEEPLPDPAALESARPLANADQPAVETAERLPDERWQQYSGRERAGTPKLRQSDFGYGGGNPENAPERESRTTDSGAPDDQADGAGESDTSHGAGA